MIRGALKIKGIIYKHKLLSIFLAAIITTSVLVALTYLSWSSKDEYNIITIEENNGIYDLTGVSNLDKSVIRLEHSTEYYPGVYLTPSTIDTIIPESTKLYEQNLAQYLSQHFVLKLPDNYDTYTLTFTLSGRHAMRVYVNGSLAGQTGTLGTDKQSTQVWENNITFHSAAVNGEMDIILNSAQFYHAKHGASLADLTISKSETALFLFESEKIKGMALVGAFVFAAVLLLVIYFLLSRTRATLYFAIACLIMALRECLQSQNWTYFPLSGNLSFMMEYLSVVLLTIFLSLYLGQYITGKFLRVIQYIAIFGSCIYGVFVIFGDSIFYTSILRYYQVMLILCIIPGITVLFYKMRNPIQEQGTAMFGIAVFYFAAIYDIAMYSEVFGKLTDTPVSEIAMLVFILAQTVSLLQMNNRVLGEAREIEQKLEAKKNALESLDRLKTEFLGNVSHELKTPLTVMSGYAQTAKQLIEQADILNGSEISRRMTLISFEAKKLSLMVGQILDVTRMEEGHMVMEPVHCYVDEIIHIAVETNYPILNKNGNRLDIHIEAGVPAVYADPTRISQVIVNLISNAVRYTVEGNITISVSKENDMIQICIEDTGTGIEAKQISQLFQRYNKKQKSSSDKDTGTGLGLYICKYIVEQHGGNIWLESEKNQGTSVFFTLPLYMS